MNWTAVGAIGELVGGVVIVITLIYLAIQIRQNTKNLRSAAIQASHDGVALSLTSLAEEPAVAETMQKGMSDFHALEPHEKWRFTNLVAAVMFRFQNSYFQNREGTLPNYVWKQQCSVARWFASRRGVRAALAELPGGGAFHPDFMASLDLPQSKDAPGDDGGRAA